MICHLGIPADAEPDGCEGIAAVMAASLFAGTQGITARRFELEAAAAGITWKTDAGWTGPAITLELPAAHLAEALDLLRLALAEPAFQPAEVTAQIQLAAASLTQAAASPQARVKQELPAAIYGDGGRAGRPAEGTPATVARLAPEDIAGFHWEQVRPAAATIVIAGDLDGLDAAALASEAFAIWTDDRPASRCDPGARAVSPHAARSCAGEPARRGADPAPARRTRPRPRPPGLERAAGRRAHPRRADHRAAGRPAARGRRAQLRPPRRADRAGARQHRAAAGRRRRRRRRHHQRARRHQGHPRPPAPRPLRSRRARRRRRGRTRMMPLDYETPAQVAAATAGLAVCGLPADFPDLVLDDIAVLTYQHVTGAYRSYISPDRLVLIAVGDAAALAGPLQELTGPRPLQIIGS